MQWNERSTDQKEDEGLGSGNSAGETECMNHERQIVCAEVFSDFYAYSPFFQFNNCASN